MKFYIDTANVDEIRSANDMGMDVIALQDLPQYTV